MHELDCTCLCIGRVFVAAFTLADKTFCGKEAGPGSGLFLGGRRRNKGSGAQSNQTSVSFHDKDFGGDDLGSVTSLPLDGQSHLSEPNPSRGRRRRSHSPVARENEPKHKQFQPVGIDRGLF